MISYHALLLHVLSFVQHLRLPWNEECMIKRALDADCQDVLTSMCHSAVRESSTYNKKMGVTRSSEEHEAAIQKTLKEAKLAGKKTAIFCKLRTMLFDGG